MRFSMRRAIVPVASVVLLVFLTTPSYGWLFHHGHVHRGGYGPNVANPFAFGFTLPGGYGFNVDTGGGRRDQTGTEPAPAPKLTIDKDVRDKVANIQTLLNGEVGDLNKLT